MDLIKTLMVYMMLLVGSATDASPAVTPPPGSQPVSTAAAYYTLAPSYTIAPTARPTQVPTRVPTAVPTLAPTATPVAYTTLYVGDRGEEVKKLQRRLAELGYLSDKIDGIYGQNTKRAVERFQYYNNLTVDGIAGKATQRVLYESRNVVTAPPDITPGPTPTATPLAGIYVPVYYVDQNGQLLKRVDMTCYGTTTIYANNGYAGSGYTLISSGAVTVTVRNGVASPASVTFRYQRDATPTEAPSTVAVPVYYLTDTGTILYQTSAILTRGATSYVPVNMALVPDYYQLASAARVTVTVSSAGTPNPASVIFTFRNATPTPEPEKRQAQIPVRYVNESGFLLNESAVTVEYGKTVPVYASPEMVDQNYRLVSQSPVNVTVNANGTPNPAVVIFTYIYQTPTAVPTQAPTAIPTAVPTMIPTPVPTAVPTMIPTPEPTAVPTMIPTPEPTAVPTMIPTPEPTALPTEAPTEAPTEIPTEVPTEAPTEVPTEAPTAAPPSIDLTRAGSNVGYNGATFSLNWYRDGSGNLMVSLKALSDQALWGFGGSGYSRVLGHDVGASYNASGVITLSVDGRSFVNDAVVWQNDLYVGEKFLRALGLTVNTQSDWLMLESE